MRAIDAWLIDRFETTAHQFQRLTGRTCNWLCINCYLIFVLLLAIAFYSEDDGEPFSLRVTGPVVYVCLALHASIVCLLGTLDGIRTADREALVRLANRTANPAKIDNLLFWTRLASLAILVSALVRGWLAGSPKFGMMQASAVFLVSAVYLMACDPLPPGTSKFRQWLGRLRGAAPSPAKT